MRNKIFGLTPGLLFVLVALIAVVISFFIYNNSLDMQNDSQKIPAKDKAVSIAERELLKHYPNFERGDSKLELVGAKDFKNEKNLWLIRYDSKDSEDASVEIIVDTEKEEVVSYRDSWS